MTRLYYGHPCPRGIGGPDLTAEELPPDGDFYWDKRGNELPVRGIRLTAEPEAWCRTWLLIAVDVPLDRAALARYRVEWDLDHESYDLPCALVNNSPRRWIRDEQVAHNVMQAHGEDEMGESATYGGPDDAQS